MTQIATEVLRILQAEAKGPPLSADSLRQVMRCAAGLLLKDGELEGALDRLLRDGKIEIVHSVRVGPRFRLMAAPQRGES